MTARTDYVFGYGSLAGQDGRRLLAARARGFRRAWNVAMDNTRDIAGYKYYVRASDGARPRAFVAFLNLREAAPAESVNGVLLETAPPLLDALDRRERNYERVDVSARVDGPAGAVVWAYLGTVEAQRRFETGRRSASALVSRAYLDGIRAGFALRGADELLEFEQSTDALPCPVVELIRIDLPPADRA